MRLHGSHPTRFNASTALPPRVDSPSSRHRPVRPLVAPWFGLGKWLRQWLGHAPQPARVRLQPVRPPVADGFSRAIECLHRGEWQAAFDAMAQAADRGDRRAARIALLMAERGPRLFSQRFCASPAQRARWAEEAARWPQDPAHGTGPTD